MIVREVGRFYERATKMPQALVEELSRTASLAQAAVAGKDTPSATRAARIRTEALVARIGLLPVDVPRLIADGTFSHALVVAAFYRLGILSPR